MAEFKELIARNVAPAGAVRIGLRKASGLRVGSIPLGPLALPEVGQRLYRFGALADIHISSGNAVGVFRNVLSWLRVEGGVAFNCVCGDMTVYSGDAEWAAYAGSVAASSAGIPVYAVAGNRDCTGADMTDERFQQYTGHGIFYTFKQGGDVFIMLGQRRQGSRNTKTQPFSAADLQSLYDTLEEYRNRRGFVFLHPFPWGGAGDPLELYEDNALYGSQGRVIEALMAHYPNALWFHGHSHQKFQAQALHPKANYDFDRGCHSIHIPPLTEPVDIVDGRRIRQTEGSQGYVVDVYDSHVVLRGMDFTTMRELPIGCYCLDTALKTVEGGTFRDDTGTIRI